MPYDVHIRAADVNDVRRRIDTLRSDAGLSTINWEDGSNLDANDHVRASQLVQMRDALQEIWTYRWRGTIPGWSARGGANPSDGDSIAPSDFTDIETWVNQVDPKSVPQGITSFSYNPNTGPSSITSSWVDDIVALGTTITGRLWVRPIIYGSTADNSVDEENIKEALRLYTDRQMMVYALLAHEFQPAGSFGSELTSTWSNQYINDFSDHAQSLASSLQELGGKMSAFLIWNEPDDTSQGLYLSPNHFAGLMHECYAKIKAASNNYLVGSGGILWPRNADNTAQQATDHVVSYLSEVYSRLRTEGGGIPWDFLNVHIHHSGFSNDDISNLRKSVDAVFSPSDRRPIIVGEWGLHIKEGNDEPDAVLDALTKIRNHFASMFYFQHPKRNSPYAGSCDPNYQDFGLVTYHQTPNFSVDDRCVLWSLLHSAYNT